jgi:hypothetical protein
VKHLLGLFGLGRPAPVALAALDPVGRREVTIGFLPTIPAVYLMGPAGDTEAGRDALHSGSLPSLALALLDGREESVESGNDFLGRLKGRAVVTRPDAVELLARHTTFPSELAQVFDGMEPRNEFL